MRTFLQICGDAWEETGLSGDGPVSVTTATGIEKRMVGWVRQAWLDIQQYRSDWPWMLKPLSFNTSPGKQTYPTVELNLTDVETWEFDGASIYRTDDGPSAETFLSSTIYKTWFYFLRIGLQYTAQPDRIFYNPVDYSLMLHPVPDAEYTVNLQYHRAPQRLAANGDVPILPTNQAWQEIIKWRALYLYAFHDGVNDLLTEAEIQYEQMIHALDNRYGSQITLCARPIA